MKSRQEILALLRDFKVRKGKKYGILRMGIFGSVARDQQTESSDVDIYYEGEAQGLFSLSHLKMNWKNCWEARWISSVLETG